eukprot:scaffold326353_cov55-Tisochrysis_lutea.AAC.8
MFKTPVWRVRPSAVSTGAHELRAPSALPAGASRSEDAPGSATPSTDLGNASALPFTPPAAELDGFRRSSISMRKTIADKWSSSAPRTPAPRRETPSVDAGRGRLHVHADVPTALAPSNEVVATSLKPATAPHTLGRVERRRMESRRAFATATCRAAASASARLRTTSARRCRKRALAIL